jgi:hypothetical protein
VLWRYALQFIGGYPCTLHRHTGKPENEEIANDYLMMQTLGKKRNRLRSGNTEKKYGRQIYWKQKSSG